MNTTGWVILGVVNAPVYFLLGKLIFQDLDTFWECIRFWFTPDLFSLFRGEYCDDWLGELRLGLWIALCAGAVFGEAHLIEKIFL